ncbi:hypothetical protein ZYGR_0P03720 [Zygosaccharomyces rouxii]|uniref:Sensitivity to high expression protein 10 n=1 Tax=Zygosaccharomyces rouxii TaxID=4956 RepID=A0A1Q3A214_ZYGRO|nr:hypothetical protein ZYGR_0P03720 [Zygosaccharomyces rouxii]
MKILTKFFLLLVVTTCSLHYYCQIGQCSTQLQRVCHYTTPSVWDELLVEKNEFYREQLNPKVKVLKSHISQINSHYQDKVLPKLVDLGNRFYFDIVSPRIDNVCEFWEEFELKPYRERSLNQIRKVRQRIWFYYSVYLKPNLTKLDNQYALSDKYGKVHNKIAPFVAEIAQNFQNVYHQAAAKVHPHWENLRRTVNAKWEPISSSLWQRCRTNEICFKTNAQLKNIWKNLKLGCDYLSIYVHDALSPYSDGLESNVRATKAKSKSKPRVNASASARGNARAGAKAGAKAGTSEISASATADPTTSASATVTAGFEDDYDDEEPLYTSTSTIMLTVTMSTDQNELSPSQNTANAELGISEQDAIKDEFEAWFKVVDQKSSGVVKTFNKEVNKYLHHRVQQLDSIFQNKTKTVSEVLQNRYKNLNRAIQDINCTCETDTDAGNQTCFDSTGTTQLSEYITRSKMRELFAEAHSTLDQSMLQLKQDLEPIAQEVESRVSLIREEMVEVYEEWGDAMVSEWSKRLAYIDVVAGHLDDNGASTDEESSENWRKFLNLKKQVIKARDELAEHPADLHEIKQFVKKVHYLIEVLAKEAGEYLYILRARANLAFQAREQESKQREDSPRMDRDSAQNVENSNTTTASAEKSGKKAKKVKRVAQNGTNSTEKFSAGPDSSSKEPSMETTVQNNVTLQI